MGARNATKSTPLGFCATGHHHLCPGVLANVTRISANRRGHAVCACDCDHPRCPMCKRERSDDERLAMDHPTWPNACVDRDECLQYQRERTLGNPRYRDIQEVLETSRQRRAEIRQSRRRSDPETTTSPITKREKRKEAASRAAPRPTSGACHHCGAPTKGGKFVIGHDAKLKGELLRAAKAASNEAAAEMMLRGWWKQATHGVLMNNLDADAVQAMVLQGEELLATFNQRRADRHEQESQGKDAS